MSSRSRNLLSCKHIINYDDVPPKEGDLVWCAYCKDYRKVKTVETVQGQIPAWRWICRHQSHARNIVKILPGKKLECEKTAIRHATRHKHTVHMYAPSGDLYHTYAGHDPNQLSLPVTPDETSDQLPF